MFLHTHAHRIHTRTISHYSHIPTQVSEIINPLSCSPIKKVHFGLFSLSRLTPSCSCASSISSPICLVINLSLSSINSFTQALSCDFFSLIRKEEDTFFNSLLHKLFPIFSNVLHKSALIAQSLLESDHIMLKYMKYPWKWFFYACLHKFSSSILIF